MIVEILGYIAGTLTTIAFIPQFLKAWKTKSTKDISLSMFLILTMGIFLWMIYGIAKEDYPIIAANAVTLSFALGILALKVRYG